MESNKRKDKSKGWSLGESIKVENCQTQCGLEIKYFSIVLQGPTQNLLKTKESSSQ